MTARAGARGTTRVIPRAPDRRDDEVIGTAEAACFARALAAREPDARVANPDFLARHFLGPWYRTLLRFVPVVPSRFLTERKLPGAYGSHAARTRHCDRLLLHALDDGAEQLVILGAGYDTRAYRFERRLSGVPVFEVDLPGTQARKKRFLRKLYGEVPSHVTYVPIDFARQTLSTVLLGAGYDPTKRTHFNWEGVSYYIDEAAVGGIFAFVRDRAAPGSTIVFDYWLRSFVEGDRSTYGASALAAFVDNLKEPFLFGWNEGELEPFASPRGFRVESDWGHGQLSDTYLARTDGSVLAPIWGMMRMAQLRSR
jgi:methyltransferase (TIGR00027 family)